jgi:hypothetical protein
MEMVEKNYEREKNLEKLSLGGGIIKNPEIR